MAVNARLQLLGLVIVIALAGCPARFNPASGPEIPTNGDSAARVRYKEAQARFERDDPSAAAAFESIVREFPDDPIAPLATLGEGMSLYRQGQHQSAKTLLATLVQNEKVEPTVRKSARVYLGLVSGLLGEYAEARALLVPFAKGFAGADEAELFAALAEASANLGDPVGALKYFGKFFARGNPAERAYIKGRVRGLVDGLTDDAAEAAYAGGNKGSLAAAFLGLRLATRARGAGDMSRAQDILDDTATARRKAGLAAKVFSPDNSDTNLLGAMLPLAGNYRAIGQHSLRGLALATGTYNQAGSGGASAFVLTVRDSVLLAQNSALIKDLAAARVFAVIGPVARNSVDQVAADAESLGLPVVTLDVPSQNATGSSHVFRIYHRRHERVRALARHASRRRLTTFAILAPSDKVGQSDAAVFREEIEALGGRIVVTVTYDRKGTTFINPVKKLRAKKFQALFVPARGAKVGLIAPQLANMGMVIRKPGWRGRLKRRQGRPIALLSTADGIKPNFLRTSGRYTVGAVFAPGFYPDEDDAQIGPFVTAYRAAYNAAPIYLAAYAYDAAQCIRVAVAKGATSRSALAAALSGIEVPGVTGTIRFDPSGLRVGGGTLFNVVYADGVYKIRALR